MHKDEVESEISSIMPFILADSLLITVWETSSKHDEQAMHTYGRGGEGGTAAPLPSSMGKQKGQELLFILNSFHLSYLEKGAFSGAYRKFSGGKPPRPPPYHEIAMKPIY